MVIVANPHGTCENCCWHTCDVQHDRDGDTWNYHLCWRMSGSPEQRLATTTDKVPPACESHLRVGGTD